MPEGVPFEITILERIGGVDIPMVSSSGRHVRDTLETIQRLSKTASTEIFAELTRLDDANNNSQPPAKKPPRVGKKNRHMASMLGARSPEIFPSLEGRERKTLATVESELLALTGSGITFWNVLETLVSRWNTNCYSHIDDLQVASLVRILLERDEGKEDADVRSKCGKQLHGALDLIDQTTDEIDAFRNKDTWSSPIGGPAAPVIDIKTAIRRPGRRRGL